MTKKNIEKIAKELFDRGAHLGHKKSKVNPKSKKFIYKIESGISIIDLTKTIENLEKALSLIEKEAKEKKKLLVVATKKVFSEQIREFCEKNNIPHITKKWPPGLLTNFETIYKNVKRLKEMENNKKEGLWQK